MHPTPPTDFLPRILRPLFRVVSIDYTKNTGETKRRTVTHSAPLIDLLTC
jgi:hypothetical protein